MIVNRLDCDELHARVDALADLLVDTVDGGASIGFLAPLDRAVDSSRACAGIILDLRGNLGGVAGMMMGVAGHFLAEPQTLGIMLTRGLP